jgi:predicted RNA-binding protein Jag
MSAYKVVDCQVKREEAIIEALLDLGFVRNEIEIHNTSQQLKGFMGDLRKEKANIIVRRRNVNKRVSGGASNDIGFEKVDGKYVAHISNYDQRWWKKKEPRFKQVAATNQIIEKAKRKGYKIKKTESKGKIKLKLIKNF